MKLKVNVTGLGLAMGAGFGTAIGVATGNLGVWLPIGVALGMLYPALFEAETKTCGGSENEKQVPHR